MPPRRWLLVRIFSLPLRCCQLHPSAPLAAQILQPLIMLGQIHVAALAGVHDLPLGHRDTGCCAAGLEAAFCC